LFCVYLLWFGDMLARLKAYSEPVRCGGFVTSMDVKGHWKQSLTGKSARLFVTTCMPALPIGSSSFPTP